MKNPESGDAGIVFPVPHSNTSRVIQVGPTRQASHRDRIISFPPNRRRDKAFRSVSQGLSPSIKNVRRLSLCQYKKATISGPPAVNILTQTGSALQDFVGSRKKRVLTKDFSRYARLWRHSRGSKMIFNNGNGGTKDGRDADGDGCRMVTCGGWTSISVGNTRFETQSLERIGGRI